MRERRTWRYLVSAAALIALVRFVGLEALIGVLHDVQAGWLLGFVAMTSMAPAYLGLQALGVLRMLGRPVGVTTALSAAANAWSIGLLTPARAGDLSLAYLLGDEATTGDLVALVMLDKILSLTVLAFGAVAGVSAVALPNRGVVMAGACIVIGGLLLVTLATRLPGVVAPVLRLIGRLSGSLPGDAYESFRRLTRHRGVLGWSLGVVLARWATACAGAWMAFRAIGHEPDILHVTAATMVGRILAALPVTVGGIGLKEPLQMTIYSLQDIPPEAVVAVSLLGLALQLLLATVLPLLLASPRRTP